MKKSLCTIIILFILGQYVQAEVLTQTFKFEVSDFLISVAQGDSISIVSKNNPSVYAAEGQPAIPFVNKNIALIGCESVRAITSHFKKRLIKADVDLVVSQRPVPTDMQYYHSKYSGSVYDKKSYPDSNCVVGSDFNVGGVPVVNLRISPFVFDADKRELYFIDSINVELDLEPNLMKRAPRQMSELQYSLLEAVTDNVSELQNLPTYKKVSYLGDVTYVIITSETLKESFKPLLEWKRKKGVRSKIITIESIEKDYSCETIQQKIKSCLMELWKNNGLEYVLLGGDVDVVPTQKCFGRLMTTETLCTAYSDSIIPADVYYSNMSDLDWDKNKDGFSGDILNDKNIGITPTLFVSRAPVGTIAEANVFVDRVIDYEQNPRVSNSFLQCGARLTPLESGTKTAKLLYDKLIKNKLLIGTYWFFDDTTYTKEPFTSKTFLNEMEKGHQFVEFISHGRENGFKDFDNKFFFTIEGAAKFVNPKHTLVTTIACHTNRFDLVESKTKRNPCMSEALIRNPQSGIIGYLGSSSYGWGSLHPDDLECSGLYEAEFYDRLLYSHMKPYDKNFGAVVAFTKMALTGLAMDDQYYRFLHYSINAIGDPEMPLFNGLAYELKNTSAEYDESGILKVTTGYDDARICVSSKESNIYYSIDYGKECSFDTGFGVFDVWITQQNYVPKHFEVRRLRSSLERDSTIKIIDVGPMIQSVTPNPATTNITINFNRSKPQSILMLSLSPVDGGQSYLYDISGNDNEVNISVGGIPRGIYVVGLREDDIWGVSSKVILQ